MNYTLRLAVFWLPIAAAQSAARAQDVWTRADSAVVRLHPSAFAQLPQAVRTELDRRGCTIPQSDAERRPHNVIEGAFVAAGSHDWAVLCSIARTSRILVFRGGLASTVDSLAPSADRSFLQQGDGGRIVFSRKLTAVGAAGIVAHGGLVPRRLDHRGIEDAFVDKASTIFYFDKATWLTLDGAD
jgi:hypothetical protein